MKITFHGAAQTVTGSKHLIEANGYKILLDCGIFQGKRSQSYEQNKTLAFDASDIDVLVLSHAHIDHSGNIPNLVKSGFTGDIVCTYATRDLCAIMLRDSGKIQEQDIEYLNRKRKRQGLPAVDPIYTIADALESLKYFIGIGYHRAYKLLPGITLTFIEAGHMLGSATVILDIEEEDQTRRLVFSGDIGRADRPILKDPDFATSADILIMESTYGNRLHDPDEPANQRLATIVRETVNRGGKVIVPAFAVGRTQELVYRLYELMESDQIPSIPVYVDSPLAINATSVYRLHPEAYDEEMAEMVLQGEDPFSGEKMRYTRAVEESKAVNRSKEPAVIISASGMAETGRILHHLKNNIASARNTILIVGWQAPHTLGRRLVEGSEEVRIFGETYKVRAEIITMNGFSGHADQEGLLKWANHIHPKPRQTFLVHGELEAAGTLADLLRAQGFPEVHVPARLQSFESA